MLPPWPHAQLLPPPPPRSLASRQDTQSIKIYALLRPFLTVVRFYFCCSHRTDHPHPHPHQHTLPRRLPLHMSTWLSLLTIYFFPFWYFSAVADPLVTDFRPKTLTRRTIHLGLSVTCPMRPLRTLRLDWHLAVAPSMRQRQQQRAYWRRPLWHSVRNAFFLLFTALRLSQRRLNCSSGSYTVNC